MPYGSSDVIASYMDQMRETRKQISAIIDLLDEGNKKEKAIKMLLENVKKTLEG